MRQSHLLRHALRSVAIAALAALLASVATSFGCGPSEGTSWLCLNPVSGKEDVYVYDADNNVNGEPDPCHCYDPCGPAKTCPIEVDAGPPGPGCDAGDGG